MDDPVGQAFFAPKKKTHIMTREKFLASHSEHKNWDRWFEEKKFKLINELP